VSANHPLRDIKAHTDWVLRELSRQFEAPPKNGAMFNATSVTLPRIFLRLTPALKRVVRLHLHIATSTRSFKACAS
jgi:hypothetical protein